MPQRSSIAKRMEFSYRSTPPLMIRTSVADPAHFIGAGASLLMNYLTQSTFFRPTIPLLQLPGQRNPRSLGRMLIAPAVSNSKSNLRGLPPAHEMILYDPPAVDPERAAARGHCSEQALAIR